MTSSHLILSLMVACVTHQLLSYLIIGLGSMFVTQARVSICYVSMALRVNQLWHCDTCLWV